MWNRSRKKITDAARFRVSPYHDGGYAVEESYIEMVRPPAMCPALFEVRYKVVASGFSTIEEAIERAEHLKQEPVEV